MTSDETLLIEIGTEELPPCHLARLSSAFAEKIGDKLSDLGITHDKIDHFATPRRIGAQIFNVPENQPLRLIQKRGPSLSAAYDAKGNPTMAAIGFAKGCGVDVSELQIQETSQGSWLHYEYEETGQSLAALLPSIILETIKSLPIPKRMRWGEGDFEFLRPIHWLTVIHGEKSLPVRLFHLTSSNTTRGHRFHFPQEIPIPHANDYPDLLKEAKVIASPQLRQEIIKQQIFRLAEENHGTPIIDEALLDQVTGLVEWPFPLVAHFDKAFLEIPQEALISSMQTHQKCFPLERDGKLLPTFIVISNTEPMSPDNIIQGNERVMRARLADAKFFYDQDRKTPLASRLEGLKNMTFQKKLGTLYDKSYRICKLSSLIAKQIGAPNTLSEHAGKLCKADLLTDMVFEFPELQGIMGSYYALNDGEPQEVAQAIRESYLPRFAKDSLPQTQTGICVALADRLDSLIGIFGIGQMPSGDKDPFGLRRQALGILRILIEKSIPLDLKDLCQMAKHGYGSLIDEEIIPQVIAFCFERFKSWNHEQGISLQTLDAVMANQPTQPLDCSRKVLAVSHFQTLPQAQNLSAANKRVRNILQKAPSLSRQTRDTSEQLLIEPAEKALFHSIETLKLQTQPLISQGKYQEALIVLAQLQKPVDTFFDEVMVMTEDEKLRQNRINLLSQLSALFIQIADISKLAL